MSYIGNQPTSVAFLTDQFSANGSGTVFTLSAAPANTASIIVAVSGVLQDPSTYSVSGTTLTFSAAPPAGTGNISVRFLGIPASGVTNTAYRTQTEFTATAGQTVFSVPSYTAGFIDVYRNGALLGSADFTATNGTTVTLANAASSGDLVETVSFYVSSVLNAIPATAGAVNSTYLLDGSVTAAKMAASGAWAPAGTVIQVVSTNLTSAISTASTSYIGTGLVGTITPKFSTSKILVQIAGGGLNGQTGSVGIGVALYKKVGAGSYAQISSQVQDYELWAASSNIISPNSYIYLDSPATTSAVSYQPYFANFGSAGTVSFNVGFYGNAGLVSITLMEIAA
jgi:hypothetical protein